MKKHIPNTITCLNLVCGCIAIVCAFEGNLVWSAYLVGIAAVLDFLDGFAARILKVHSEIGKQLDSLADMVTFGVVPGMVMLVLIHESLLENKKWVSYLFYDKQIPIPVLAFFITIFSALRLAKFNIDTRQTDSFIGLPTPANALLICSLPLIIKYSPELRYVVMNSQLLLFLTFLLSYLLIAELPLFALKFKNFGWADNKIRYVFLIISLVLLIVFQFVAIPLIIFLYIIMSVVNNRFLADSH